MNFMKYQIFYYVVMMAYFMARLLRIVFSFIMNLKYEISDCMFNKLIYVRFYFVLRSMILMMKMIHSFFIFHHQKMINDYSNTIDCFVFLIFSFLNYHELFYGVRQHHLMNHIMKYLHQQIQNFILLIFNYLMLLARLDEIYQLKKLYLIIFLNSQNNLPVSYHLFLHLYLMVWMLHKHRKNFKRNLQQLLVVIFQLIIQFKSFL